MKQEQLELFKDDFALLIEAGFIAVKQLDETDARRIFTAAQALNKSSSAPQIGLGYIALNKLEVKEAAKIFTEVVKLEPDNLLAQTFLAICYLLVKSKREKGEEMIKAVLEKTEDPTIINLCNISIEWAEKDLSNIKKPYLKPGQENF